MQLITMGELTTRTEGELATLFRHLSKAVIQTERGTPDRTNALGSLENIARARALMGCKW